MLCYVLYFLCYVILLTAGGPGGECHSSGEPCDDAYSICIDGVCVCNDVKGYVIKQWKCVKNGTYLLCVLAEPTIEQ